MKKVYPIEKPGKKKKKQSMKYKLTQKRLKEVIDYNPKTGLFNRIRINKRAGYLRKDGYIFIKVDGFQYLAQRLAFLYMLGYFPENEVDHPNRIRHDNRWCNLREVSHQCNMRNCKVRTESVSGVTGVWPDRASKKWRSQITVNKKPINLGYFIDIGEAVKARWEAEKKYNFPNCNTTSSALKYLEVNNCL